LCFKNNVICFFGLRYPTDLSFEVEKNVLYQIENSCGEFQHSKIELKGSWNCGEDKQIDDVFLTHLVTFSSSNEVVEVIENQIIGKMVGLSVVFVQSLMVELGMYSFIVSSSSTKIERLHATIVTDFKFKGKNLMLNFFFLLS
jgi:hypothetical protein